MVCPPFLLFNKLWVWGLCRLIGSYCARVFSHPCVMFNTWTDYLRLLAHLYCVWCSKTIEIRFKTKSVLCQLLASFFPASSSWLDMATCLCMQWSPHVCPPILCSSFLSFSLLGLRFLCVWALVRSSLICVASFCWAWWVRVSIWAYALYGLPLFFCLLACRSVKFEFFWLSLGGPTGFRISAWASLGVICLVWFAVACFLRASSWAAVFFVSFTCFPN